MEEKNNFFANVVMLQSEFTVGKTEYNQFGRYNYRSLETLLSPLKKLLPKYKMMLSFHDEVVEVGPRFYIKSTAKLCDAEGHEISAEGYAREPDTRKGADSAQVTGGSISYARKYALQALLLVSEPDPDSMMPESQETGAAEKSHEMALHIKMYLDKFGDSCKPFYANGKASIKEMSYEERKYTLEALEGHFGVL